ncbi:hypothetical protein [Streptomyces sp. NPDC088348]|uniref:hypothetical protein n=1 Tax=Streptomyces sp. NPDC088348 TaxID=3365853 RepID=UPI00382E989E
MSSTYWVLCLSHDPAITEGQYRTTEAAAEAISAGIEGHPHCDLLISRVSGAPIGFGCPPSKAGGDQRACHGHREVEWTDAAWLRVLAYVHQSTDDTARSLVRSPMFRCWSWERLRRLRHELQIIVKEEGV